MCNPPNGEEAMKITSLEREKKEKAEMEGARNVYKQVPISKNDGVPHFSFRVFTIEPKGHTPFHTHSCEHENYIIEGHGAVVTENGEHEIKKGDFVFIAPDEKHQYRNQSNHEPLVMICAVPKEYE
jgi:quercetin dioxygenase-like cupin family protein